VSKQNLSISIAFLFFSFLVGHARGQTLSCNSSADPAAISCAVEENDVHCGSAVGVWGLPPPDYYSSWYYYVVESQDSNGNLSGYYEGEDYEGTAPLSGHFDPSTGSGQWTVDFTDNGTGSQPETDYFQIHPPGCNTQTFFSDASHSPDWWTVNFRYADLPTGQPAESDVFNSWAPSPNATSGLWDQTLAPSTLDFNGRVVTEETYPDNDPVYHSADSCHFEESELDEVKNSSVFHDGSWIVHADNNFGWDLVEANEDWANYYQLNENPSNFPCGVRVYQKMVVYENDYEYPDSPYYYSKPYQTNQSGVDIWIDAVATLKSGVSVTKVWP
jgi:hypothetical protein